MEALKDIVAAATSYTFMWDGRFDGVVLAGPLGSVAAWSNGLVERDINQRLHGQTSSPYWAHHTDPARLECAKADFAAYAGILGYTKPTVAFVD